MRKRDILMIIVVTMFTFPVLYVVMLFVTGSLRVEYGFKKDDSEPRLKLEEVRHNARRDSLAAQNSKIFQALEQERAELLKEQEKLAEQQARLEMLQADIEAQREDLVRERLQLELKMAAAAAVTPEQREQEEARYKKLAKIYEAMKPGEAAAILQTMPDAQVARIISRMNDDRQKGRIMALLSKDKTARINKLIK